MNAASAEAATGSTGAGGAGVGGGANLPHEIEIVAAGDVAQLDGQRLILSREDGSLIADWPATSLPLKFEAVDGSFVSLASGQGKNVSVDSFRIEAGVARIALGYIEPYPECSDATMLVHVHVPSVPGYAKGYGVFARASSDAANTPDLPADFDLEASSCDGGVSAPFYVAVDGPSGFLAFEYAALPFVAGGEVDWTPSFAPVPRTKLTLELSGVEQATDGGSWGEVNHPFLGLITEWSLPLSTFQGDPFQAELNVIDAPFGFPFASAKVDFPPPAGACESDATLRRHGASSQVIPFAVGSLGTPSASGNLWTLDGPPGHFVRRDYRSLNADPSAPETAPYWTLYDDAHKPRPAVFPVLPSDFVIPSTEFELWAISNVEWSYAGSASYADWLADVVAPWSPVESRWRTVSYRCD